MKKIVDIISVDSRYRRVPYPSIPVYDASIGNYLTGQHYDPNKPDTKNNLTKDEIERKTELSDEKMKRFPYIIYFNEEIVSIPIIHLTKLDISEDVNGNPINPKDKALYNYYRNYCDVVAPNKEAVQKNKHYFYINDDEQVSTTKISKRQRVFKAMKLVDDISIDKMMDIAILLNYYVKGLNINVSKMKRWQFEDFLGEQCEQSPDTVIECFTPVAQQHLNILKMINKGILKIRGTDIYEGNQYIGSSLDKVIEFMRSNEGISYATKWTALLNETEETIVAKSINVDKTDDKEKKANELRKRLKNSDIKGLRLSAKNRGLDEEEYMKIESEEELLEYIISKI